MLLAQNMPQNALEIASMPHTTTDLQPVRPGVPGKIPFWNEKAVQFLYPPVFDVKPVKNALKYNFLLIGVQNDTLTFDAELPSASLAPIWTKMQNEKYNLTIFAVDSKSVKKIIFTRAFHKAAGFQSNGKKRLISIDESVKMGLDKLVHSPELKCWFTNIGMPDTAFIMYRYPTKMVGSAASVLSIYASQNPAPADAVQALVASRRAADYLISLNFIKGDVWEFHPRTYHPYMYQNELAKHKMDPDNLMTNCGAEAGQYLIDVFKATNDKKYLNAAVNIGNTYVKNQLTNGSWYLLINGRSGVTVADNIIIPTSIIEFLRKLSSISGDKRFETSSLKALDWMYKNPVKTWDWQGQFEDVRPQPSYQNLTKHEACDFAIYLLDYFPTDVEKVKLAVEIIRFTEDQFVIWSNPPIDSPAKQNQDGKGTRVKKWLTPCVLEQYKCYAPVSASSSKVIRTYLAAYRFSHDKLYLNKANALATTMINLQQTPMADGRYLTWVQKNAGQKWLNCELATIKALNELKISTEK